MTSEPSALPGETRAAPRSVPGWLWMGSDEPVFQRVANQIEQYIIGHNLTPGNRLPGERELCDLIGVSRASVREALRGLQARGMVEVHQGKGVFVSVERHGERALRHLIRLREVGLDELFAMREVLEVPAAGWAAIAATDQQLAHLARTYEALEQAVAASSPASELQVIDARLHLEITQYAGNRFLAMTQEILQQMLARSMDTTLSIGGRPARSVREHAEIVSAILARESARARAAARRHIRSAHRAAQRRITGQIQIGPAPPLVTGAALHPPQS